MSEWTLYWITRLDGINIIVGLLTVFSGISSIIYFIIKYIVEDVGEDEIKILSLLKHSFIWFFINVTILCFLPTTKEMFIIKTIPVLASQESVEKLKTISPKLLRLVENYVDEKTEKTKKDGK